MARARCRSAAMIALIVMAGALRPGAFAQSPVDDVRGLWVLRTSITSSAKISELVDTAVTGGYNTLLVQVRGRGDAFYDSRVDPRSEELRPSAPGFDPLDEVIQVARARGLKVHAWFNVNLVANASAGPISKEHVAVRHPEWLMVPRPLAPALLKLNPRAPAYLPQLARWTRGEQDSVEGLYVSPIPEASQEYTLSVVRDLMTRYPVDGLHLDYIRYPTEEFDYSAAALEAFRTHSLAAVSASERDRLDALRRTDPLIWTRAFPGGWDAFRRDRLTTLVERIRAIVRNARPGVPLSAAVVPVAAVARARKLQDWSAWAGDGLLDVVCPMAYATDLAEFAGQVDDAQAAAHGRPVWAGIGAWRLPVARTAAHIREARRSGAAGVLLFSYDSLLTATAPRGTYFVRLRSTIVPAEQ